MSAIAAMLISTATGACVVWTFWPAPLRLTWEFLVRWCLSAGLGLGLSACASFLWLMAGGAMNGRIIWLDAVVLLAAGACLIWRMRHIFSRDTNNGVDASQLPRQRLWMAVLIAAAFIVATLLHWLVDVGMQRMLAAQDPHGEWDAWAIWNLRARFIFRGGDQWTSGFSKNLDWSHPDYPLLLPMTVSRIWAYLGGESVAAASLLSSGWTCLIAALLLSAVAWRRGTIQGTVAATVLATSRIFVCRGVGQCADVPLAFYLLAVLVVISASPIFSKPGQFGPGGGFNTRSDSSAACLAGLALGCAAWTKNEGLLFCAALTVSVGVVALIRSRWRDLGPALGRLLLGALLPILCVVLLKTVLAGRNDLVAGQTARDALARLGAGWRHRMIWEEFYNRALDFPGEHVVTLLAVYGVLSGAYRLLAGPPRSSAAEPGLAIGWVAIFLIAVGYWLVYALTPHDLGWHLRSSSERLFVQVWPSALFLFFAAAPRVEDLALTMIRGKQALQS